MASALTPMIRTDEEKRKHPFSKMIGVIPDFVHCPYHIAFDTIFYQHFLANKDSVVAEVEDLIGGSFELHYTPCVMSRITKNRFRTDLAFKYVNFEEVRCYDDVGYVANDFNCLSKVMQEEKDLILATGNNRLRVLCRKITHAPIIFLEDGALFFEGLHRGRNVVTEIEDPIGNTFLGKKILEKVGIRREAATPSKLYVGNLEWEVDDEWLKRVFSKYGEVIEARVICDRETGRSRGFGFVTMASKAEMNKAIARLDGKDLYGRKIWVNVANERPNNGSSSKKVKTERERKPVKDTLVSAAKNGKAVEGSSSSKQAAGWASSTGHVTEYESRAVLMHKGPITSHDPFAKFKSRLSTKEIEDEASRGTLSSTKTSKRKRKGSDYAESASCAAVASKKVKTDNETKSVKVKLASAAKNGAGVKGASSSKPATTSVSSAGPLTEDEIADKFQSRLHTKEVPDASSRIIHGGFVRSGFGGSNCNSGGRTGGHGFFGSGVGRSSGYGGSGGGFGSSSSSYGGDRKYGGRFSFGGGRSSGYGGTGGRFGSGGGRSSGDGGTGGRFGYRSL